LVGSSTKLLLFGGRRVVLDRDGDRLEFEVKVKLVTSRVVGLGAGAGRLTS
jgi:hypothetical protein